MCMCVSHKSPTAQQLVSYTEISCLDNQRILTSLCLSGPWHKTHGTSMWSLTTPGFTSTRRETFPLPFATLLP